VGVPLEHLCGGVAFVEPPDQLLAVPADLLDQCRHSAVLLANILHIKWEQSISTQDNKTHALHLHPQHRCRLRPQQKQPKGRPSHPVHTYHEAVAEVVNVLLHVAQVVRPPADHLLRALVAFVSMRHVAATFLPPRTRNVSISAAKSMSICMTCSGTVGGASNGASAPGGPKLPLRRYLRMSVVTSQQARHILMRHACHAMHTLARCPATQSLSGW
jgi:hypothetical protein